MIDLGGNTEIVKKQLLKNKEAIKAITTIEKKIIIFLFVFDGLGISSFGNSDISSIIQLFKYFL